MKNMMKTRVGLRMTAIGGVMLTAGVAAWGATWNTDADGNWNEAGKWDGGVPNAVGATASLSNGISADRVVTLDQSATVGALVMTDTDGTSNSWTLAQGGAHTLTLDVSSGSGTLTVSQGTNHSISVPVAINDPLNLSVANGTKLTMGGNLSGSGKITTKSPGTVRLSGDNGGFSGGIYIDSGAATRFELMNANALGSGSITFHNSANGPVFTNASGGALLISTPIGTGQSHTTNPRYAGNDMTFNSFRLSDSITVNHVFYIDGNTTLTLPNGIAGGGSRKAGSGNLTLTGASAGGLMGWEGGGTLRLGHDQALGNGTTFRAYLGTYIPTGGHRILANQTTFGTPGQNLTFDLSGGSNLSFSHASVSISHDFNIEVTGPGILTIVGNVTGTMRPDKRGTGALILSGNNTGVTASATAGLRLHAGTLGLGHDNALGPDGNRLDVRGGTLMAVGGARTLANPVVYGGSSTLTIDSDDPITFNGLVSVPNTSIYGNLLVNRGMLRINGDNTGWNTSSPKTINDGGTLIVGHANALGTHASSVITVNSNGTFGVGSGVSFSRAVTFNEGSALVGEGTFMRGAAWTVPTNFTVRPGLAGTPGTLTIGTANNALTLLPSSTLAIEANGVQAGKLVVDGSGSIALAGALKLRGALEAGSYVLVDAPGGVTGTFAGDPDVTALADPHGKLRYTGTQVLYTVPPRGTMIFIR